MGNKNIMDNSGQFPAIVIAFAIGAFLPYLSLSGKIEQMNHQMEDVMQRVDSINDRIDHIRIVEHAKTDANVEQVYSNDVGVGRPEIDSLVKLKYEKTE